MNEKKASVIQFEIQSAEIQTDFEAETIASTISRWIFDQHCRMGESTQQEIVDVSMSKASSKPA